jgi:hypothetical protein
MSEKESIASKSPPNRGRLNDRFVRTVKPEAKRKLHWDAESWREYWSSLFVLDNPEPNERLLDGLQKAGLP